MIVAHRRKVDGARSVVARPGRYKERPSISDVSDAITCGEGGAIDGGTV